MAKINIDKLVVSLLNGQDLTKSEKKVLHYALQDQGLRIKDGEIVSIEPGYKIETGRWFICTESIHGFIEGNPYKLIYGQENGISGLDPCFINKHFRPATKEEIAKVMPKPNATADGKPAIVDETGLHIIKSDVPETDFGSKDELAESEDVMIKEKIIATIHLYYGEPLEDEAKEMIAWLEKQGKNNMGISEATKKKLEDNLNKALEKEIPESWNKFLDEQGEQKPRYSIGDVLCDKSCTTLNKGSQSNFEITDIRNGMYICDKCSFPISQQDEYELVAKRIESAWSEEDEDRLNSCVDAINAVYKWDGMIAWLKSLKERVQPMQEWSEEDKEMRMKVLKYLSTRCNVFEYEEVDNWLKSLKPQNTWKPSESDIRILEQVIDGTVNPINYHATLYAILEQLKKLRE